MNFVTNDEKTLHEVALQFGTFEEKLKPKEILKTLSSCLAEDRDYWLDRLVNVLAEEDDLPSKWTSLLKTVIFEADKSQCKKLVTLFQLINDKICKKTLGKKIFQLRDGLVLIFSQIASTDCKDDEEVLLRRIAMLQSIIKKAPHNFVSQQKILFKFLFQHMDVESTSAQDAVARCFSKLPLMCKRLDAEKSWSDYISCIVFFLKKLVDALLNLDRDVLFHTVMFDVRLPVEDGNLSDFRLIKMLQTLTKCGVILLNNAQFPLSESIVKDYYVDYGGKIYTELNKEVVNEEMILSTPKLTIVYSNISALTEAFILNFAADKTIEAAGMYVDGALFFLGTVNLEKDIFSVYQKLLFRVLYAAFQRCQEPLVLKYFENARDNLVERLCNAIEIVPNPKTAFFEASKHEETEYALRIILLLLKMFQHNDREDIIQKKTLIPRIVTVANKVQTQYKLEKSLPVPYRMKDCRMLLYECVLWFICNYEYTSEKLGVLVTLQRTFRWGTNDPDNEIREYCKGALDEFTPSLPKDHIFPKEPEHVCVPPTFKCKDLKQQFIELLMCVSNSRGEKSHKTGAQMPNLEELRNGSACVSNSMNSILNESHPENPAEFFHSMAEPDIVELQDSSSECEKVNEDDDDIQQVDDDIQQVDDDIMQVGDDVQQVGDDVQQEDDDIQLVEEMNEVQGFQTEEQLVNLHSGHGNENPPQCSYDGTNLCDGRGQKRRLEDDDGTQPGSAMSEIRDFLTEQLVNIDPGHRIGSTNTTSAISEEFQIAGAVVEGPQRSNIAVDDDLLEKAEINDLCDWFKEKIAHEVSADKS